MGIQSSEYRSQNITELLQPRESGLVKVAYRGIVLAFRTFNL
jgi:hypothetical protein